MSPAYTSVNNGGIVQHFFPVAHFGDTVTQEDDPSCNDRLLSKHRKPLRRMLRDKRYGVENILISYALRPHRQREKVV